MNQQKDTVFAVNIINYTSSNRTFTIEGSIQRNGVRSAHDENLKCYFGDVAITYTTRLNSVDNSLIYRLDIPAGEGIFKVDDLEGSCLKFDFTQLSRLGGMGSFDYRLIQNFILAPLSDGLSFLPASVVSIVRREIGFFFQSLRKIPGVKYNVLKTCIIELLRVRTLFHTAFRRREIWLFSDRMVSGGDNSEALFKYTSKQHNKKIRPFFVVNKQSDTYKRLKREGYKVVKFRSLRHLYLTMVADLLIPSHLDMIYMYPWPGIWKKYSGLTRYDIVHTQHGIVLNDISSYVGKQVKNAQLFLSICDWEKKHLIEPQYGYTEAETPVTGAPRYDELSSEAPKRVISLHPTWRSWLAPDDRYGERSYMPDFMASSYYKFYQALLNNDRIIKTLEATGYTLKFYLHPNHRANRKDFSAKSERVQLMDFPYDYTKMFNESAIFVTDYSNTLFDFAYLRKPIVHTQFDAAEFFSKQRAVSRQLFDYEQEGFGLVCKDYDSAVDEIVKVIRRPEMSTLYRNRADEFFTYSDKNNAKRAYEAILKFRT